MDTEQVANQVTSYVIEYLPSIVLLLGGLLVLLITALYLKDKDSVKTKLMTLVGAAFGVAIAVLAVTGTFNNAAYNLETYTLALIVVAAFTMIIRPVKDLHVAVIIGLFVMALVYLGLGGLNGKMLGPIDLTVLSTFWPRLIVSFIVGGLVYSILHFAEAIVKLIGGILNWWPLFFIMGLLCIADSICIIKFQCSVFDYIIQFWNTNGDAIIEGGKEIVEGGKELIDKAVGYAKTY